jgi:hypothetical protein
MFYAPALLASVRTGLHATGQLRTGRRSAEESDLRLPGGRRAIMIQAAASSLKSSSIIVETRFHYTDL